MPEKFSNESQLLESLRKGSVEAYEQVFRIYWKPLYIIARSKVQSHAEAEEIIQSIFSNLWEKRKVLIIHDLFSYLQAAVRNRILNTIRSQINKEKYWDYYKAFIPAYEEHTHNVIAFQDLKGAVDKAVSQLPEKSREVFKLSRMEGKSNAEIADKLALSEKAIEYHLTKCLRVLRVTLKDYIL